MWEFILRRTKFKNLGKEGQDYVLLLKDQIKMHCISKSLIGIFEILPLATFIAELLTCKQTLSQAIQIIIMIVAYVIFAVWLSKRFHKSLTFFEFSVFANLYSSQYILKGNAISKDDFDIIEKEDVRFHHLMMTLQFQTYCYILCFDILKYLKKEHCYL